MSNLYRGPSNDVSYQISIHLAKRFRGEFFFKKSINQKQELPVVDMFVNRSEWNEQSLYRTFYRCFLSGLGSFGQAVSVFRGEDFLKIGQSETRIACGGQNQPIRNKNCLWRPYLLTDQDEMSNLYRGPSIDDSSWFGFIWQSGLREDF